MFQFLCCMCNYHPIIQIVRHWDCCECCGKWNFGEIDRTMFLALSRSPQRAKHTPQRVHAMGYCMCFVLIVLVSFAWGEMILSHHHYHSGRPYSYWSLTTVRLIIVPFLVLFANGLDNKSLRQQFWCESFVIVAEPFGSVKASIFQVGSLGS
jgi:hypothetical protein